MEGKLSMAFVLNTLTFPSHLNFTPMQMDLQLEGCYCKMGIISPLKLRKLMKAQLRWLIHEKQLFIMVNCFKSWQQYLKSQKTRFLWTMCPWGTLKHNKRPLQNSYIVITPKHLWTLNRSINWVKIMWCLMSSITRRNTKNNCLWGLCAMFVKENDIECRIEKGTWKTTYVMCLCVGSKIVHENM